MCLYHITQPQITVNIIKTYVNAVIKIKTIGKNFIKRYKAKAKTEEQQIDDLSNS